MNEQTSRNRILSDHSRQLINNLERALGCFSDEMRSQDLNKTSARYARGYLNALAEHASSEKVVLTYVVVRMIFGKST